MENLELPGGGCYLEQVVTAHSREPKVPCGRGSLQVWGGLRGTSVHTARASSSSEAEAACFAWMDLRPGGWDHVVPPLPWRWLRAQLWRPLGSVC